MFFFVSAILRACWHYVHVYEFWSDILLDYHWKGQNPTDVYYLPQSKLFNKKSRTCFNCTNFRFAQGMSIILSTWDFTGVAMSRRPNLSDFSYVWKHKRPCRNSKIIIQTSLLPVRKTQLQHLTTNVYWAHTTDKHVINLINLTGYLTSNATLSTPTPCGRVQYSIMKSAWSTW